MGRASELGGSLLASKQRRDDKYNDDRESYEKKQALFSLIVPPLVKEASSWIQKDNIRGFDKNEALIKENRDASKAYAAAQNWMTIDKEVQEQGGSAFNYYANLNRPEAERRAAEAMRTADMNVYVGKHGPYQEQITQIVDGWAEDQATKYDTAMGHLRRIGTPEEYTSLVELARSDARSDDIFGTLFQKAKNYVTGTTKEEVDNRAIQAISNSRIGKNIDLFNLFQNDYKKTRDVMRSYDFVKMAAGLKITDKDTEDEILWTIEDRKIEVDVVDKKLIYRGQETHTALNDPTQKRVIDLDKDAIDFNEYGSVENADRLVRDLAREVYDKANFHTLAFSQLTPEGFQAFTAAVEKETKMDMIAIEASDDIAKHLITVGSIYQQLAGDSNFLKNKVIEGGANAMFATVVSDSQTLFLELEELRMLRDSQSGEERYQERLTEIQNLSQMKIQSIIDVYAELQAGEFLYIPRTNP